MKNLLLVSLLVASACGASDRSSPSVDGGDRGDGGSDGTVRMTGTVWAPGNAPGLVPSGHEIPVYNALVYLATEKPSGVPQSVYCEACSAGPQNAVSTDHKGNFELPAARVGEMKYLVIQKGQFLRIQEITVAESHRSLTAEMTTLPSETNAAAGTYIPKIALASGTSDQMEAIFGKLDIGEVDGSGGFVASSAAGHFDVYSNGGVLGSVAIGTVASLVADLEKMKQYHIIFFPCSTASNNATLSNQQTLKNLRDYVKAGGRLYVADWSGEWMDMVFPAQIELNTGGYDTPANAYDPVTDTWDTSLMGSANDGLYDSPDAEVTEPDMFQWLDGQVGPGGPISASAFDAEDNWNIIRKTYPVQVGVDEDGAPVMDDPKTYVIGSNPDYTGKFPLTVTFEPAGCGRVLYTTYHSVPGGHTGLVPQERILAYLLMEIGVCKTGPVVE